MRRRRPCADRTAGAGSGERWRLVDRGAGRRGGGARWAGPVRRCRRGRPRGHRRLRRLVALRRGRGALRPGRPGRRDVPGGATASWQKRSTEIPARIAPATIARVSGSKSTSPAPTSRSSGNTPIGDRSTVASGTRVVWNSSRISATHPASPDIVDASSAGDTATAWSRVPTAGGPAHAVTTSATASARRFIGGPPRTARARTASDRCRRRA